MMNVLIVDDEVYAVEALVENTPWSALGIDRVLTANDADEAMEALRGNAVDIMLCDIEMPGMNGLELTEWVSEEYPAVVIVFLTGHADFSYARQAVKVGGFDYLLKPVGSDALADTLRRAAKKVEAERESRAFGETVTRYKQLWEAQKPHAIERLWHDILSGRLESAPDKLRESAAAVQLPFGPEDRMIPVLISVERWHKTLDERDEAIMVYALCNVAEEILIGGSLGRTSERRGAVIHDRNAIPLALLDAARQGALGRAELEQRCRAYIDTCRSLLSCTLSCYVGTETELAGLSFVYHGLIEQEHDNVNRTGSVSFLSDKSAIAEGVRRPEFHFTEWESWTVLLESGKKEELSARVGQYFAELGAGTVTSETIVALYHSIHHMLYHVAHKKGWSMAEWFGTKTGPEDASAMRSLTHLQAWAKRVLERGAEFVRQHDVQGSALIAKIQSYVQANLTTVTRESIASHVYLNEAYLSRLFKKETGQSLVDYIIQSKMNRAKVLLTESDRRIIDICESLGYDNLSYFGKTFKKLAGLTPQEYRKRYQALDDRSQ